MDTPRTTPPSSSAVPPREALAVQHKLIDGLPLNAADRHVLAASPELAELAELTGELGPTLGALAAEERAAELPAASVDLLARVRARVRQQAAALPPPVRAAAPSATVQAPAGEPALATRRSAVAARPRPWLNLLTDLLSGPAPRWALATVLMGVLVWVSLVQYQRLQPIGLLRYTQAPVRLAHAGNAADFTRAELRRATTVSTGATAGAILQLGRGAAVNMALAPRTVAELSDGRALRLARGTVWLNVTPGGRGFRVQTPAGEVIVTGTLFGVTVGEGGAWSVEVAQGSVRVTSAQGGEVRVEGGQQVSANTTQLGQPVPRGAGTEAPAWVQALAAEEQRAAAGHYVPSVTTH